MQEVIEAARELAQSQQVPKRSESSTEKFFQFRSRGKTSKEGNNGLDKKDLILKKSLDSFYIG